MEQKALLRIRLLSLSIMAVLALFLVRLFFIQIVEGEVYRARADRQYERPSAALDDRGDIFFETKDSQLVSAATMRNGFTLALEPRLIRDPETLYRRLNAIVPMERGLFLERAGKRGDPYEELIKGIDEPTAAAVKALDLTGVLLVKERFRVYPAGRLAAHAIGFMAYDGDKRVGRYGLERQYDAVLERQPNQPFIGFLAAAFSELSGTVLGRETETEADLVLTIEPTVEQTLEQELAAAWEKYHAAEAGGIILDPETGAILALAARPDFDPGAKQDSIETLRNPLAENVYEFGSIVKPLMMAAALDAGVLTPETTYTDYGTLILDGRRISNYDGRARGTVNMQAVLNQSLNTGMVFVAGQLGPQRVRDYFYRYGFGEPSGVDLPNEADNLIGNLESPREVEYATAAFGQGIAVSPLAMARALAALGNGGRLPRPYLVKRLERRNTKLSDETEPELSPPIFRPETSRRISEMLVRVVDEALAGGTVKLEHYRVAAKTGTAQMARPEGGYYDDRYLHSFFGYFPADQPRYLILLYLVHPQGVRYSSETLTVPFMNLTKFLIHYYNLPPDR